VPVSPNPGTQTLQPEFRIDGVVQQPSRVLERVQIAEWIGQQVDALKYARHKVKIAHRDLKPANPMVDVENDLKVTDFDIARSISDTVSWMTHIRQDRCSLAWASVLRDTAPRIPSR
jgi:serine/threonine protein kinase